MQTTDSKQMPRLRYPACQATFRNYDRTRRRTLQSNPSALYAHPRTRQAIITYSEIIQNGKLIKSILLKHRPPEMVALSAILHPRCGLCKRHECPLFSCTCCGIVHYCSHQCYRIFLSRYPNHRSQDQRFCHFGVDTFNLRDDGRDTITKGL